MRAVTIDSDLATLFTFTPRTRVLGWVFRHCGVGTPIDPHDLLRSLRWTPVGVGPQPGYTRRLGKQ